MPDNESGNVAARKTGRRKLYAGAAIACLLVVALAVWIRASRQPAARGTAAVPSRSAVGSAIPAHPLTAEQRRHVAEMQARALLPRLRTSPDDPELLARLGYLYYSMGNFSQAAGFYQRSVDRRDDPVLRVELGRAYYLAGAPDKAIAEFEKVVKADPGNANALHNLGVIRWQQHDTAGAIAAWEQLLRTNPNHPRRAEVEKLIAAARVQAGDTTSMKR